jgi:hypothetical protein
MHTVTISRAGVPTFFIKPDDSSTQTQAIMGENKIQLDFKLDHYADIKIGDTTEVFGTTYMVNQPPVVKKVSSFLYEYSLQMDSEGSDLAKVQFLFLNPVNQLRESDFSLMGNADTFIDLLLENLNRIFSGWTKGQVIPSDFKNLSFSKENCYNALGRMAEEFDTEFWIEGKVIHLTKRRKDTSIKFQHGKGKGLYEIQRLNYNNSSIATRLYLYGSDKNLPVDYSNYSKRLRLPGFLPGVVSNITYEVVPGGVAGTEVITFHWLEPLVTGVTAVQIEYKLTTSIDEYRIDSGSPSAPRSITVGNGNYLVRFRTIGSDYDGAVTPSIIVRNTITVPVLANISQAYIERNVDLYGVIEETQIYDDVFPHRTGVVSAVDASNPYKFVDTSIDFDLNSQLLPGLVAKVTFNTGQLSGYTFDISAYNSTTKEITFLKNKNERTLDIPNTLIKPAIGDKYVFTDIRMPQSYITAAEQELLAKGTALLSQISEPQVSYTVDIDPVFVRKQGISIAIGNEVMIEDIQLQINKKIRVVRTTRNIVQEDKYQVELSDIVSPSTIARILSAQYDADRNIAGLNAAIQNNSLLNGNVIGPLNFASLPTTSTTAGYSALYIEDATGKLFRKI